MSILYEASYIGSSKVFLNNVMVVGEMAFAFLLCFFRAKKAKMLIEKNVSNVRKDYFTHKIHYIVFSIFAVFFGIVLLILVLGMILGYNNVILRYKRGEYREVEGIVEDYRDSKVDRFTVNGVEFEISEYNATWGYSYWHNENVVEGDGQHLKIRYLPPNRIVYIEEIADE